MFQCLKSSCAKEKRIFGNWNIQFKCRNLKMNILSKGSALQTKYCAVKDKGTKQDFNDEGIVPRKFLGKYFSPENSSECKIHCLAYLWRCVKIIFMNTIYFDNAATSKICDEALNELIECEREYYANASSLHLSGQRAAAVTENARDTIASLIGAEPDEIYFTSGATEGNNILIKGAVAASVFEKPHVITSVTEHPAVVNTCRNLAQKGLCELTLLGVDENGKTSPEELAESFRESTALVSLMFANNEVGVINPVKSIAALAHSNGALYHCDAVQAVGKVPINVKEAGMDMLTSSAHKFCGPKGIGFMYIRRGVKITPTVFGGEQERELRPGTINTPAISAMAVALKTVCEHMEEESQRIKSLRDMLCALIVEKLPNVHVNAGEGERVAGILNVSFPGVSADKMLYTLDGMGLRASAGSACSSGSLEISPVIKAMNAEAYGAPIRFSLGRFNTEEEVATAAAIVEKAYGCLTE